ncbi:NADP-dependent oxidoreductase domain-containing protein [Hypoxylon rubiginosum]|uniref:NADP-dependent oxidoreductase domain-containing protein n=1 Tax=Hypoxylon rubiginosum TaxID=110542 RepID=A0ACC0D2T2_9PEZI|nr:NADP-dependent oxidoreductase domain-containing protein [Hypoxylon rubiginosum]
MAPVPTLKLSDGNEIPVLSYGFGTANFGGKEDDISTKAVMAIKNGYYHLDCAEVYNNESGVGAGIKASGVPREKLFVTTKVTGSLKQDISAALDASLQKLGLDYIDLYLLHVPFSAGSPEGLQDTWRQVESTLATGKVKSIGVSNFEQDDLEILFKTAKVKPVINQIEYHPYLQHGDLVGFCRKHGIVVAAYSPLAAITAARPGPVDDVYAELAKKYGVSEGDVAFRWCLDQDIPVITTSAQEQRLQGYMNSLFKFKLTPEEIAKITELGKQKHYQGVGIAFMTNMFGNYKTGVAPP